MRLVMQSDSIPHMSKTHGRLPRRSRSAGLDRPLPRKECHPGQVKSRAVNSGCGLLVERRDIGYTRLGGGQLQ
jgi:hypothetical protein